MLFGFVGAVIGGFLLTAVPNWTGRLPIAGWPLAGLSPCGWRQDSPCSFRLRPEAPGPARSCSTSASSSSLACSPRARYSRPGNRNAADRRNDPALWPCRCARLSCQRPALFPSPTLGWQLAIAIAVLLISVIGGRIIPSFTRNWMVKQGMTSGLPTPAGSIRPARDRQRRQSPSSCLAVGPAATPYRHPARCRGDPAGSALGALERLSHVRRSARPGSACRLSLGPGGLGACLASAS